MKFCFKLLAFLALVTLSGCDSHDAKRAMRETLISWGVLQPQPSPKPAEPMDPVSLHLKQDEQILREVFQVVLLREPYPQEFAAYANTLSQGASIEGLYNGFVNSSYYKQLEDKGPPANGRTLRAFSTMLLDLQRELLQGNAHPSDYDIGPQPYTIDRIETAFKNASIFKLKHVLGTEVMRIIEVKSLPGMGRESLALWYSHWAAQMAQQHIDFGLPLRNNTDAEFHRKWLMDLPNDVYMDRVIWESLNRVNRVLNSVESAALKPPTPVAS